jgi:hypothetical protein
MDYLYEALWLAQGAFTIWMLVDAYRRQVEWYWFLVILLVQPFGTWVYFFVVKVGDFQRLRDLPLFQRKTPLVELRYRAEQVPTLANRLALAQRLVELHEYDEAVPHLEAVLKQEPTLSPALFALAKCHQGQERPEQAIALLEKILARDVGWSNYAAWHLLIEVQAESGEGQKALAKCRDLARIAPTLHHKCLLGERLLAEGMNDEAAQMLERSLEEHQFAPAYIRRRNYRWANEARRLQRQALSR